MQIPYETNHQTPDAAEGLPESSEQLLEQECIEQSGSVRPQNARHLIHCLNIIGQIEGHDILPAQTKTTKYEHVLPALVAIEQDRSIEGLLILVNTVGGDVEAGLAIAEMIAGMRIPTVSLVIGGGHSIGVPLAVCAKQSLIVPSASMTLHPVRTSGLVLGTPQTMTYLMQIQDRITSFVTRCSRISEQRLLSLMHNTSALTTDLGTILSGRESVSIGLIDRLGTIQDALDCLYAQIEAGDCRYTDTKPLPMQRTTTERNNHCGKTQAQPEKPEKYEASLEDAQNAEDSGEVHRKANGCTGTGIG